MDYQPPMRVLLLTPPMTQLNTPYPATSYLAGFLADRGHQPRQVDLSIGLALRWLSRSGLQQVAQVCASHPARHANASVSFFLQALPEYLRAVDPVVRFLQGRDNAVAYRIVSGFLPEGPRFATLDRFVDEPGEDPLGWAFGALGLTDRARHLATLFVEDLADVVQAAVDPRFGLVRYAERLAHSQPSFDPLHSALTGPQTLLDTWLDALVDQALQDHQPELVAITAPFAGNAYGALRAGRRARTWLDGRGLVVLGGGWVNTDLRDLRDPRVFDFVDRITLDAGERPLLQLIEGGPLVRTYRRHHAGEGEAAAVVLESDPTVPDVPFDQIGTPSTAGLQLDAYLGLLDTLNPMHRLWADTRWNKLTVAHGCYWRKCAFCDTSLDYIRRYEPAQASTLVDRIESLVQQTGQTGFHFVDEAAPPAKLDALARELLRRDLGITWWGNVRFERSFSPERAELLAESGCVALTGGLEVAGDRLLGLMDKGVSVPQVARVTHALSQAGILVHAYLMYGFPTQTLQETVDALEIVRQLFLAGCVQSAFWHRFTLTVHSPIARDPDRFGIRVVPPPDSTFGANDLDFVDPTGTDHDALGPVLDKALYNYLHGIGLFEPAHHWFEQALDGRAPVTSIAPDWIERSLQG